MLKEVELLMGGFALRVRDELDGMVVVGDGLVENVPSLGNSAEADCGWTKMGTGPDGRLLCPLLLTASAIC